MTDQSAAPCLRRSACREGGNSPCGTGEHGERHADTERHHNHTHAPSSHHPGSHHLLTVEGLTVSFDRYAAACVETRDSRGEARAGNSGPSSRLSRIFSQRSRGEVLHGLTLSVHEGEMVAVVGASGSGKTVLADALLGLYEPNSTVSGEIWFDGEQMNARSLARLRGSGVSLVPQSVSHLDPLMRVGRQVQGAPRGVTRAERLRDRCRREVRQRELFELYGLAPEVEQMYPHELSGGMARRVLLMCALMEEPRLLIADEPTPGLDVELSVRAVDDLRAFADTGAGVILITHDLELAVRVADRIAVFKDGRVVEETAARCFANPHLLEDPFSQALCRELIALHGVGGGVGDPDDAVGASLPPGSPDAAEPVLLEAHGLSFAYAAKEPLFADVELTVRANERVALLGASGAGKTTLCRVLAGYMEPSAGSVRVEGASAGERGRSPRRVQLISQHPEKAFDPRMRMEASLAEAGDFDAPWTQELLECFGIHRGWLDRLPHELSGGELMRFCLVRAFMTRPAILICDESTAMLDLVTQAELWRQILHLQVQMRFGLIFVSHHPALVRRIATRSYSELLRS